MKRKKHKKPMRPVDIDALLEKTNGPDAEIVEIDEHGRVWPRGEAPASNNHKPTVLRDPVGEYGRAA